MAVSLQQSLWSNTGTVLKITLLIIIACQFQQVLSHWFSTCPIFVMSAGWRCSHSWQSCCETCPSPRIGQPLADCALREFSSSFRHRHWDPVLRRMVAANHDHRYNCDWMLKRMVAVNHNHRYDCDWLLRRMLAANYDHRYDCDLILRRTVAANHNHRYNCYLILRRTVAANHNHRYDCGWMLRRTNAANQDHRYNCDWTLRRIVVVVGDQVVITGVITILPGKRMLCHWSVCHQTEVGSTQVFGIFLCVVNLALAVSKNLWKRNDFEPLGKNGSRQSDTSHLCMHPVWLIAVFHSNLHNV